MALPSVDPSAFTQLPDYPISVPQRMPGGMFGPNSVGRNIAGAIGDFLMQRGGGSPLYGNILGMQQQARMAMLRDNLEFQRQMGLAQFQAQLAQMYPTDALSVALRQSGVQPGSPQWQQAQQTQVQNIQNPVVNAGMYGPVLRSQVAGAANAQPPSAPVGKLTPIDGGPTPPASGNFPY